MPRYRVVTVYAARPQRYPELALGVDGHAIRPAAAFRDANDDARVGDITRGMVVVEGLHGERGRVDVVHRGAVQGPRDAVGVGDAAQHDVRAAIRVEAVEGAGVPALHHVKSASAARPGPSATTHNVATSPKYSSANMPAVWGKVCIRRIGRNGYFACKNYFKNFSFTHLYD